MTRRLFTLASLVGLLLFLATVALWVRSYWIMEAVDWVSTPWETNDQSIAPPEPEVATTELAASIWPGQLHLYFDRQVTTRNFSKLFSSVRDTGLHRSSVDAAATNGVRQEPWSPRPKAFLGFTILQSNNRGEGAFGTTIQITIPMWAFSSLSILPTLWVARRLRARGVRECTCKRCHYNLTANTSGVCPECGTPVPGKA